MATIIILLVKAVYHAKQDVKYANLNLFAHSAKSENVYLMVNVQIYVEMKAKMANIIVLQMIMVIVNVSNVHILVDNVLLQLVASVAYKDISIAINVGVYAQNHILIIMKILHALYAHKNFQIA